MRWTPTLMSGVLVVFKGLVRLWLGLQLPTTWAAVCGVGEAAAAAATTTWYVGGLRPLLKPWQVATQPAAATAADQPTNHPASQPTSREGVIPTSRPTAPIVSPGRASVTVPSLCQYCCSNREPCTSPIEWYPQQQQPLWSETEAVQSRQQAEITMGRLLRLVLRLLLLLLLLLPPLSCSSSGGHGEQQTPADGLASTPASPPAPPLSASCSSGTLPRPAACRGQPVNPLGRPSVGYSRCPRVRQGAQ